MCQIQLCYYHVNRDLNEITSVSDVIMSRLSKLDFTEKNIHYAGHENPVHSLWASRLSVCQSFVVDPRLDVLGSR